MKREVSKQPFFGCEKHPDKEIYICYIETLTDQSMIVHCTECAHQHGIISDSQVVVDYQLERDYKRWIEIN